MNYQGTVFEQLKAQMKFGGMHVRLLIVNAIIFLFLKILYGILHLSAPGGENLIIYKKILYYVFTLDQTYMGVITKPWGLITALFTHEEFMHFFSNMLFLYFSGMIFVRYFGNKQLLSLYILGGIMGGLLAIVAHEAFPTLSTFHTFGLGASGSIMAIFGACAFYRPMEKMWLFGLIEVPIIAIFAFYILSDLSQMYRTDTGIGYFAHLGGALAGFLYVAQLKAKWNLFRNFESMLDKIVAFFKNLFSPRPKVKSKPTYGRSENDDDYLRRKKANQETTDKILAKISKSGYDSLTKAEKEFLFSQSDKK